MVQRGLWGGQKVHCAFVLEMHVMLMSQLIRIEPSTVFCVWVRIQ